MCSFLQKCRACFFRSLLQAIVHFVFVGTNGAASDKETTPSVSTKKDEETKSENGAESTESATASTSKDPSPGEKRCVVKQSD